VNATLQDAQPFGFSLERLLSENLYGCSGSSTDAPSPATSDGPMIHTGRSRHDDRCAVFSGRSNRHSGYLQTGHNPPFNRKFEIS
jgi:hypothetical protein